MKLGRVIIMTGLVGVIFMAIIGMFVYTAFSPNAPADHYNDVKTVYPSQNSPTTSVAVNQIPETETTNPNTSLPAPTDCEGIKALAAQGKQYEKGSLLVTFLDLINYDLAIESVQALGLRVETSSDTRSNFDSHHWLTVSVPRGEEFKWQCALESSEGIKNVSLNLTFQLRQ